MLTNQSERALANLKRVLEGGKLGPADEAPPS
jgi:hypothetical protein